LLSGAATEFRSIDCNLCGRSKGGLEVSLSVLAAFGCFSADAADLTTPLGTAADCRDANATFAIDPLYARLFKIASFDSAALATEPAGATVATCTEEGRTEKLPAILGALALGWVRPKKLPARLLRPDMPDVAPDVASSTRQGNDSVVLATSFSATEVESASYPCFSRWCGGPEEELAFKPGFAAGLSLGAARQSFEAGFAVGLPLATARIRLGGGAFGVSSGITQNSTSAASSSCGCGTTCSISTSLLC